MDFATALVLLAPMLISIQVLVYPALFLAWNAISAALIALDVQVDRFNTKEAAHRLVLLAPMKVIFHV
jgi:hypothetical protein